MKEFKICRGQNKAFGFVGCGNEVKSITRKYGLCRSCFAQWSISTPEGEKRLDSFLKSHKKSYERKAKQQDKKDKDKLTDWKFKLQEKVNLIVRLIDIGLPCLARNYHPNQIHAGHIFSRGSNSSIKFNLHNIHRQSAQSNHYQNEDGLLREGLMKEYGNVYFEFISSLRGTPDLKYSNEEYHEFYRHASKIANELKKQGRIFPTTDERIFMRNEINNQLGIYNQKYCQFNLK